VILLKDFRPGGKKVFVVGRNIRGELDGVSGDIQKTDGVIIEHTCPTLIVNFLSSINGKGLYGVVVNRKEDGIGEGTSFLSAKGLSVIFSTID